MSSTNLYKPYTEAMPTVQEVGYLKAWISPKSFIDTLVEPAQGGTPALGEMQIIGSAHTWATGKGAIPLYIEPDQLEAPGDLVGEKGSLREVWKPKLVMIGDGAEVLELLKNVVNKELIVFVQDQCNPATYIQFGCDCAAARVIPGSFFQSGNLKGGRKGYELQVEAFCKFFYEGTITEQA